MVMQLFWVLFRMPETKGRTLEELSVNLQKKHNE
jgi:MFS transporter, SP family, arabinose:H+ symporter